MKIRSSNFFRLRSTLFPDYHVQLSRNRKYLEDLAVILVYFHKNHVQKTFVLLRNRNYLEGLTICTGA